jgi:2-methylisocitrate lyase-like PEP mutase family enzyme
MWATATVGLLEDTGVAGLHIEDLTSPPRPRHTGSKSVIVLAAGLSTAGAKAQHHVLKGAVASMKL